MVLGSSERAITTNTESCGRVVRVVAFSDLLANVTRLGRFGAGGGLGATVGSMGFAADRENRRANDTKAPKKKASIALGKVKAGWAVGLFW